MNESKDLVMLMVSLAVKYNLHNKQHGHIAPLICFKMLYINPTRVMDKMTDKWTDSNSLDSSFGSFFVAYG